MGPGVMNKSGREVSALADIRAEWFIIIGGCKVFPSWRSRNDEAIGRGFSVTSEGGRLVGGDEFGASTAELGMSESFNCVSWNNLAPSIGGWDIDTEGIEGVDPFVSESGGSAGTDACCESKRVLGLRTGRKTVPPFSVSRGVRRRDMRDTKLHSRTRLVISGLGSVDRASQN